MAPTTTTTTTPPGAVPEVDIPDPLRPIPHKPNMSRVQPPAQVRKTADAVAVARAHAEDVQFSRGPARRPQPRVADPLLQWASGLPTADKRLYAGWLVEAGKD